MLGGVSGAQTSTRRILGKYAALPPDDSGDGAVASLFRITQPRGSPGLFPGHEHRAGSLPLPGGAKQISSGASFATGETKANAQVAGFLFNRSEEHTSE